MIRAPVRSAPYLRKPPHGSVDFAHAAEVSHPIFQASLALEKTLHPFQRASGGCGMPVPEAISIQEGSWGLGFGRFGV